MSKNSDDKVEMTGTVIEICKGGFFNVRVKSGSEEKIVLAYPSGKIRKFAINIVLNDTVVIETSPYDLTKGRIVYRNK